jgi:hypothetical protein
MATVVTVLALTGCSAGSLVSAGAASQTVSPTPTASLAGPAPASTTAEPQRSASETVPDSETTLTVEYNSPSHPGGAASQYLKRYVSGRAVRRLIIALNAMEPAAPGSGMCTQDFGERAWVYASYPSHQVGFALALQGCGPVQVSADRQVQPELQSTAAVRAAIYAALGIEPPPYRGLAAGQTLVRSSP